MGNTSYVSTGQHIYARDILRVNSNTTRPWSTNLFALMNLSWQYGILNTSTMRGQSPIQKYPRHPLTTNKICQYFNVKNTKICRPKLELTQIMMLVHANFSHKNKLKNNFFTNKSSPLWR